MGFFLLASLFSLGIGFALTDWISGSDEEDETSQPDDTSEPQPDTDEGSITPEPGTDPTPEGGEDEPVQGEMFAIANSPDDPTEGTEGNDLIRVLSGAAEFDAGDGDDVFSVQTMYNDVPEGQIGAVLTGGEGADSYTFNSGKFTEHHHYSGETVEITDFNPEEDQLVIPLEAFYGVEEYDAGRDYGVTTYPFESIAAEPAEDGTYTDVVIYAKIVSVGGTHVDETTDESLRIRLWGLEDFNLNQIMIDRYDPVNLAPYEEELSPEAQTLDPQPIQLSDGSEIDAADNTLLVGDPGPDTVTLNDTEHSTLMTRDGDDTIAGSGETVRIYSGGGDDSINATGNEIIASGEAGNDTINITGLGAYANGGADDDVITVKGGSYSWIEGGTGDDVITHSGADYSLSRLYGGDGNDTITGGLGDIIFGGEGQDDIAIHVDSLSHDTYSSIGPGMYTTYATIGEDHVHIELDDDIKGELFLHKNNGVDLYNHRYQTIDLSFTDESGESFSIASIPVSSNIGNIFDGGDFPPFPDIDDFISSNRPITTI